MTGALFLGRFAVNVAAAGASVHYLNYVLLIPSLAVPAYMVLHVYSLVQLLSGQKRRTGARAYQS